MSEAAGKGVPGLALDDAVDSQVVFETIFNRSVTTAFCSLACDECFAGSGSSVVPYLCSICSDDGWIGKLENLG